MTEVAITLQGDREALLTAAILFAVACLCGWLLLCAARGSWRPPATLPYRPRAVRIVLTFALLLSAYLLSALPLGHQSTAERTSALVLSGVAVLTVAASLLLQRAPRLARGALVVNGAYGVFIIARLFWTLSTMPLPATLDNASGTLSILLALGLAVALVVALIAAWPLVRDGTIPRVA